MGNLLSSSRRPLLLAAVLSCWILIRGCDHVPTAAHASTITKRETLSTTVTVPSAAILNLFTAPYQVIAAPGANRVIVIHSVFARLNFGTLPYVPGFGNSDMIYGGTTQAAVSAAFLSVISAAATSVLGPNPGAGAGGVNLPPGSSAINAPVVLRKLTQDFTTGDGTLTLWINYDILNLN